MKKQTSTSIIAILIGIIAIQYFISKGHVAQQVELSETEEVQIEAIVQEPIQPPVKPVTATKKALKLQIEATLPEKNIVSAEAKQPEEKITPPRSLELTLNEETVSNLEKHLNDLSVKVVLRREDRGWRVDYIIPDNLMTSTGIQNNDLVLYELIETAKSNPRNRILVTRLESIFSTLER